jgi:hypothetical protein
MIKIIHSLDTMLHSVIFMFYQEQFIVNNINMNKTIFTKSLSKKAMKKIKGGYDTLDSDGINPCVPKKDKCTPKGLKCCDHGQCLKHPSLGDICMVPC